MVELKEKEYVSASLYEELKQEGRIPLNFDLEKHNEEVIERLYQENLTYFQHMYDGIDEKIKLDEEQIKAILCDEDYSLIIAGAGTGKTTTMASKVKYLVDKKKIDPSKILVMSYTKKATQELENRIVYDFGIPANVTTFHSLGMMYLREIYINRKIYVVDEGKQDEIFLQFFKEKLFKDKKKLKEIIDIFLVNKATNSFLFSKFFLENYEKFQTFENFFDNYKNENLKKIELSSWISTKIDKMVNAELPRTIKNELVKSKKEALIANFLFQNGIDYQYEKIYEELMDNFKTYKPDFTLDLNGEEVYLEYFGISDNTSPTGKAYFYQKKLKENYHRMHHTQHIFLEPEEDKKLLETLETKLKNLGFVLKKRSNLEIYHQLMNNNPSSQIFGFKYFLYSTIKSLKESNLRPAYQEIVRKYISTLEIEQEREVCQKQFEIIDEFYHFYQLSLYGAEEYGFDYEDMIYYALKYMDRSLKYQQKYKYVIIDEYQDISQLRYEFTKKIVDKNHAKIVAVGDDWQTIYSFAGSKIEYVYNFQKYYPGAKLLRITKTYRNSQELIDYSGKFIMKNENQIKKDLVSNKKIGNPIQFIFFKENEEYQTLKQLILNIHSNYKNHKIMILARTNSSINRMYLESELIDGLDTKVEFIGYEDLDIDGMTIHKSKGLTSDEVIVIGLNEFFPSHKGDYWMNALFKHKTMKESIPYAEERRLFYVALTRTKNRVYLLVNKNPKHRSPFINEIYNLTKETEQMEKNF